jgi:Holliday junction DNA helicase RuvB
MDTRKDDRALRPLTFSDFLGQDEAKRNLSTFVKAARSRGEPLDHLLLTGRPGLGKTTLANIIANEMGSHIVVINASTVKVKGDLARAIIELNKGDILFIDEIHSLRLDIEELLYTAMEDYRIDMATPNGAVSVQIAPFTLIGATTRAGDLSQPLRDRFGEIIQMKPYTNQELTMIVLQSAPKLGLKVTEEGAYVIGSRSRGTPRVANRLTRRARDFAFEAGHDILDGDTALVTCKLLGVDAMGLDSTSQKYLSLLSERQTPIGVDAVAAILGEARVTIEDAVEPFLMSQGLIERTPKGRMITSAGDNHVRGVKL